MSLKRELDDTYLDDHEWLNQIMNLYGEELTRIAYLYLKEWNLAEDAVQETFVKCFQKRAQFRGDSSQKTWIYTILTNTCKDFLKSAFYKKIVFLGSPHQKSFPATESAENLAIIREREYLICQCVLALPVKYREVIILFYYNSFTIKEISNMLRISEAAVRVRLNRGRGKLEKIFTQGGNLDEW
ncbi:sigma-70 family RNA polymerase sigma factor [Robertmurraya kyonggiensis]|uniref:Sigma-70 family RNA polymerase sigma factor n=1 Tax=Robertmurraya kyonggiensis TaxID=1037680 RepID=A0A4V5P209_9BACI|nr:sigma-70 family RNA polymerase sigma factor [Robertmurraya kyonggiensis]TKC19620.1 sigma-70 family RNA polymerase sigma factor [Robertmurraya kyonggiensis]